MPCTCGHSWKPSLDPVVEDHGRCAFHKQQDLNASGDGAPPEGPGRYNGLSLKNAHQPQDAYPYYPCSGTNLPGFGYCRTRQFDRKKTTKTTTIFALAAFAILLTLGIVVVVMIGRSHARLLDRVSSLEKELSAMCTSCCDVHCGEHDQRSRGLSDGDKRSNKFAFLMTRNSVPGSDHPGPELKYDIGKQDRGVQDDSRADDTGHRTHPIKHIKEKESGMAISLETPNFPVLADGNRDDNDDQDKARSTSERARSELSSDKNIPLDRFKRRARTGGKRKKPAVALATNDTDALRHIAPHDVRGVHYQANLNRTTTIGVAGWMPHWAIARSMNLYGAAINRKFRLSPRGNVTVVDAGLYYVYSQMMYYDPSEYIGHSIVINGVEAFTCIAPIAEAANKYKTCFIGGLAYVPRSAKVGVRMLYTPRQVCLFEDTSYFGMFRVT